MTHRMLPTVAMALAGIVAAPAVATAAPTSAPATALTAAASPSAHVTRTAPTSGTAKAAPYVHKVDVDGDGRRDTVTLSLAGARGDKNLYRLSVWTAARRSAATTVAVAIDNHLPPKDLWLGAADFDGVRGNEILLDLGGGLGDFAFPTPTPGAAENSPSCPRPAPPAR